MASLCLNEEGFPHDEKNNDSGNINDKYINGENYLKGLKDLSKYSKMEPKDKVVNKNGSFFTKIYYNKNDIDKINKIGNNVKDFLRNKNNLKKKNIIYDENNNEQNGLYIDKIYIPKFDRFSAKSSDEIFFFSIIPLSPN